MAFTPDGLPCIGFLRPGLVVAAGYNGYGGSYATAAGHAATEMILTGAVPDWVPEEIFSPRRLLQQDPMFLTDRDGLWRIADSLCRQLISVNRKTSDELSLYGLSGLIQTPEPPIPLQQRYAALPATRESIAPLPCFQNFAPSEIILLAKIMRRWDLPAGTILFAEGEPGGSCFVISEGEVDVSINSRGRQQLLATLTAGNLFGQVSLITGMPRSATCSVRKDAVLLEIERTGCERLLRGGTAIALKLLAVLNEGLVLALRNADLRLMRMQAQPPSALSHAS
jgi:hypothetical protein